MKYQVQENCLTIYLPREVDHHNAEEIKAEAVHDLNLRIAKILKNTPMEDSDRERLTQVIDTAAGKVVNKMIFGLRDALEQEAFLECVAGLEKLYEE